MSSNVFFNQKSFQLALAGVCLAGSLVLSGCSANFGGGSGVVNPIEGGGGSGGALVGNVHGGQQPVFGSTVQLWTVGTTGYGASAQPLGASVQTNSGGGFTLGSYSCPTNSYAYITASGGNPQTSSTSPNNPALALMTALGPCSSLSSSTYITINEVTTVAAVWALGPFMTSSGAAMSTTTTTPTTAVGTSGTNLQGIANAMKVANLLANSATGATPGTNTSANATVEYWQVNALADILALCVNSTGVSSTTCAPVVTATTNGSIVPADTLQMAYYLQQHPTVGTSLLAQIPATPPPFQPYSSTVNDWTIGVSFATGTAATRFVAPDQFGNIWVAANAVVEELDPIGNLLSSTSSYTLSGSAKNFGSAFQVAVDTANNAWVSDQSGGAVVEFTGSTSAGGANGGVAMAVATGSTSTEGIAVDGSNNVWYTTSSGKVFELAKGAYGTPVGGATTTSFPYSVAIDMSNNPASPNYTVSNGGSFLYTANYNGCSGESLGGGTSGYGGSLAMAYTVAASTGTPAAGASTPLVYIANAICNTTTKVATNGGLNFMSTPAGLAFDSSNNIWIANQGYTSADTSGPHYSLTKAVMNYGTTFTAAAIGTELSFTSISGGGLTTPWYIAMDGASNAWVSNSQGTTSGVAGGTMSEFSNAGTALSTTTGYFGSTYAVTVNSTTTTYRRVLTGGRGIAVDGSGNLWMASSTTFTAPGATSAAGYVTMVVGAGVPTVVPLSLGIQNDTLGTKP